jgi:nucleoside-diphosphate-sugar epimerase
VLGGAGFIGAAVVRELLALQASVVSFDNYLHGRPEHLAEVSGPLQVIKGNVLDNGSLISVMREICPHFIINCVGDTFVPTAYLVPERFFAINVLGTLHALEAAKAQKVERFVHLSSTEVYGIRGSSRISEGSPLDPVNSYAVSKLAADRLCATYALEHSVPMVIARLFNTYGPRETHPYVIPEIIAQLSRGTGRVTLGNVDAERDLTYVQDTARAIVCLLAPGIPGGSIVNVGSDNSYSVRRLVGMIAKLMGIENVAIARDPRRFRVQDIPAFRCDNSVLRRLTGWQPEVPIMDGLARTIEWFHANGSRWCWQDSCADLQYSPPRHQDLDRSPSYQI